MIKRSEVFPIGQLSKPHGLKGEMTFNTDSSVLEEVDMPFIVLEPEGIFVPFYIENLRFKSYNSGFIRLEGITTEEQAREFSGQIIYALNEFAEELTEDDVHIKYFIGFGIVDETSGKIGTVTDIDESTENILFIVQNNAGNTILIPAVEEYITEIDEENKTIRMELPEGLLEI